MSPGDYLRSARVEQKLTVSELASRIGIDKSYISRFERGQQSNLSTDILIRWVEELELDVDVVLAMAGQISPDLQEAICKRPRLFADMIRSLRDAPDHAILRVARDVRDGDW